jgi:hypothetical protein
MTIPPFARALKVSTALAVLVMGETLPQSAVADSNCAPAASANQDVLATMGAFSLALRIGNIQLLQTVTSSDFLADDIGDPVTAPALIALIQTGQVSSTWFDWNLTQVGSQVDCDMALIYTNPGAAGQVSTSLPPAWLPIAILKYTDLHWQVADIYSTRAALAQQQQ